MWTAGGQLRAAPALCVGCRVAITCRRHACRLALGPSHCRLLALAVGSGPSGAALDFRHAARSSPGTMDELGRLVLNACQAVRGGVVVFFPSFSYADQVHAR